MAIAPIPSRIQDFLSWQARTYSEPCRVEEEIQSGPFVTVSRAYGCEGVPLANRLTERLNEVSPEPTPWVVMGREVVQTIAQRRGAAAEFVGALSHSRRSHIRQSVERLLGGRPTEYQAYQTLAESLVSLAEAGRVVLVGGGAAIACAGLARGYRLHLVAPREWRAAKISRQRGLSLPEAEATLAREEEAREAFVREFTGKDGADPEHYDVVFNNGRNTVEEIADLTVAAMRAKRLI